MTQEIKRILDNDGFVELYGSEEEFLDIASTLGKLAPSRRTGEIVDILLPKEKEEAHLNSLSNRYGLKALPYHTDGAYNIVPPKYIALRYFKGAEDPTPTIILPLLKLTQDEKVRLRFEMWNVRGNAFNFYSSLLTDLPLN
ncbi:MAG TPA: hypothetical protein VN922_01110, partial [Bacteroidia bacterium]|nr:hypothetical protein [Bacteroidia bacterium]